MKDLLAIRSTVEVEISSKGGRSHIAVAVTAPVGVPLALGGPFAIKGFRSHVAVAETAPVGVSLAVREPFERKGFRSHVAEAETAPVGVPLAIRGPLAVKGFCSFSAVVGRVPNTRLGFLQVVDFLFKQDADNVAETPLFTLDNSFWFFLNLMLFLPKVLSWCVAMVASKSSIDFFRFDALERREEAGTVLDILLVV